MKMLSVPNIVSVGVLVLLFHFVKCEDGDDSPKTGKLTENSFDGELSKNNFFIMFYVDWCRHSRNMYPMWKELADKFNDSRVTIGNVNCDEEEPLCTENRIVALPTLKFFKKGSNIADEGEKFKGQRNLSNIFEFINEEISKLPENKPSVNENQDNKPSVNKTQDTPFVNETLNKSFGNETLDKPLVNQAKENLSVNETNNNPFVNLAQDKPSGNETQDNKISVNETLESLDIPSLNKTQDKPSVNETHDKPSLNEPQGKPIVNETLEKRPLHET
ncbi:hypothetical protein WDU94_012859 [Cyamophila willieti]